MKEGNSQNEDSRGRKPLKVLSTSLGIALAANLLAVPAIGAEGTDSGKPQPKLVEWSSEAVKAYYDPNVDWNLALPEEQKQEGASQQAAGAPAAGMGAGGASGGIPATVVHSGGGFDWDDILLYHLLFNRGGAYSTSSWSRSHDVYDTRTNQPYMPRSYSPDAFLNRPVAGSTVRPPQTASKSGSFSTPSSKSSTGSSSRSTSSSPGGIGGKSSGFSSSGASSGSSFGS